MIDLTTVSRENVIRQWVDALRSGKYEQGQHYLRSIDDKYCCLGVLCDVLGVTWDLMKDSKGVASYYPTNDAGFMDTQYLPIEIADFLGVTRDGYTPRLLDTPLTVLNDQEGWPFAAIADEVVERFLGTANSA